MEDEINELDGCLTEFPPALEEIDDKLQSRESEFFWPNELTVVEVTRTIGFLEGEGLYAFWSADLKSEADHQIVQENWSDERRRSVG